MTRCPICGEPFSLVKSPCGACRRRIWYLREQERKKPGDLERRIDALEIERARVYSAMDPPQAHHSRI